VNPTRLWTVAAVGAIVAVLGIAFALVAQPHLAAASDANSSVAQIRTQNDASRLELARLSKVAATQSTLDDEDAALNESIPSTLKLNLFTRQVQNIAALDQVRIAALTPSAGVAYAAPADAAPVAATPAPSASASATPAPSSTPAASAAPAVPAGPSPWFGKTDALITTSNFTVVPVTVVVTGTDAAVLDFTRDAQELGRLFAVSAVSTIKDDITTTATLTGSVYVLHR
jgi:TolA-binding protein